MCHIKKTDSCVVSFQNYLLLNPLAFNKESALKACEIRLFRLDALDRQTKTVDGVDVHDAPFNCDDTYTLCTNLLNEPVGAYSLCHGYTVKQLV